MNSNSARKAMSPAEFCETYGIGLTTFYAEVKRGRLAARKIGRRTIVLLQDAEQWAASLPATRTALAA
jgi:hypothetical protein